MWFYHFLGSNHFKQAEINPNCRKYIGKTFYTCNYICPECGDNLFKSNIKAEYKGNIGINTDKGMQPFSSVFLCPKCRKLYSVGGITTSFGIPRLSEGHCFVLEEGEELNSTVNAVDEEYGAPVLKLF